MKRWLTFALVLLAALAGAEAFARLRAPRRSGAAGSPAPAFTLPAAGGSQVSLEALRGRVVAVNFWATWCEPCKAEIPDLAALYTASRGKCLEILGVAEDSGTRDEVAAAAKDLGINYPVLFDDDGRVGEAFQVQAYPRTYLVDVKGKVRKVFEGAVSREDLERGLAPLLAEAPGGCAKTL